MKRVLLVLTFILALVPDARALELTSRGVNVQGKIDAKMIRGVVKKLLELDSVSHEPIFLHIDSGGGSVEAGFILIDAIAALESPVYALVESKAYSMAAIITVFCDKRYILPHATLMFHEVSYGTLGEDPSIRSRIEFNTKYIDRLHHEIARRIGMSHDVYRARIRDGWWLLADEAKEAGVVDEVVTELSYRPVFVEKTEIKKTISTVLKKEVDAPAEMADTPPAQ